LFKTAENGKGTQQGEESLKNWFPERRSAESGTEKGGGKRGEAGKLETAVDVAAE